MLTSLEWEDYAYEVRFEFLAINNVAEFEAFLAGLRLVEALNAYPLQIYSDSHLVIGQEPHHVEVSPKSSKISLQKR